MSTDTKTRVRRRAAAVATVASTSQPSRTRSRVRLFARDPNEQDESRAVKVIRNYAERQVDDPFTTEYGTGGTVEHAVLRPAFDLDVLLSLPNQNHTLKQCIDAMVTNIECFGHRLEYVGPEDQMESAESVAEKSRLSQLLERPNADYGLKELRSRCRMDKETVGYSCIEVIRGLDGSILALSHIPAHLIRKTKKSTVELLVNTKVVREGKVISIPVRKRFRLYVQMVGSRRVYFKEFGDPRIIDYKTGMETSDKAMAANELVIQEMYSPNHTYGVPRWINQLPAIIGSREAEVVNLSFFQDNAIPAMAILVAGGKLTGDSVADVETAFSKRKGLGSMNRVLVIEALGDQEAADADGKVAPPRLEMKPLAGERQSDALFATYDDANHVKIRSSFRLPPLFLGRAEDYTRASAEASLTVAETQVFAPERSSVDDVFNSKLLQDKDGAAPRFWAMRSNPARMTSPEAVLDALKVFNELGALTPNIAIGLANEMFDLGIELISEEWGDMPFQMALNKANATSAVELDDAIDTLEDVDTDDETAQKAIELVTKSLKVLRGMKDV